MTDNENIENEENIENIENVENAENAEVIYLNNEVKNSTKGVSEEAKKDSVVINPDEEKEPEKVDTKTNTSTNTSSISLGGGKYQKE